MFKMYLRDSMHVQHTQWLVCSCVQWIQPEAHPLLWCCLLGTKPEIPPTCKQTWYHNLLSMHCKGEDTCSRSCFMVSKSKCFVFDIMYFVIVSKLRPPVPTPPTVHAHWWHFPTAQLTGVLPYAHLVDIPNSWLASNPSHTTENMYYCKVSTLSHGIAFTPLHL
jgi:hypothetical protein